MRTFSVKRSLVALVVYGLGTLHGAAWAQTESVIVKRAAELREAPGEGRILEALSVNTALSRLGQRQGPWVQVRTAQGKTGWVHMFDVGAAGSANQANSAATGGLRSIANFFSRGTQNTTTTATSTVGIRGLGEEDLARAQPNIRAVGQMEAQRIDAGSARQFAANAALVARQVDELPGPAPFSGAASRGGGQ